MANVVEVASSVGYGFGVLGIGGFVFSFLRFSSYKETVKLQNDNIKALQDQASILETNVSENNSIIHKLQSRIEIVETLPLEAILNQLKQIATTQNTILKAMSK